MREISLANGDTNHISCAKAGGHAPQPAGLGSCPQERWLWEGSAVLHPSQGRQGPLFILGVGVPERTLHLTAGDEVGSHIPALGSDKR